MAKIPSWDVPNLALLTPLPEPFGENNPKFRQILTGHEDLGVFQLQSNSRRRDFGVGSSAFGSVGVPAVLIILGAINKALINFAN